MLMMEEVRERQKKNIQKIFRRSIIKILNHKNHIESLDAKTGTSQATGSRGDASQLPDASANNSASGSHQPQQQQQQQHHHHSTIVQKNFKQKLKALVKKFRNDASGFDSEEQYREALEKELMKAAAGRGSCAIEELLDDEEIGEESGSEPDDDISESSTPKPSLRPFFSSTTLDKI